MRFMVIGLSFGLAAALVASPVLADSNEQKITNGGAAIIVKALTCCEKGDSLTTQTVPAPGDDDICIPANGNHVFVFDDLTCAVRKKIEACEKPGEGSDKSSFQEFIDPDPQLDAQYPVLFATDAHILYAMTNEELALIGTLADGASITVVIDVDQSGTFPPSVIFRDADTELPYSGTLTSAGSLLLQEGNFLVPAVSTWAIASLFLLMTSVAVVSWTVQRRPHHIAKRK